MKIETIAYRLKNKNPFRIAHGERTATDTLLVKLHFDKLTGIGEAAHVPYYGIHVNQSMKDLHALSLDHISQDLPSPEEFFHYAKNKLGNNHFALCALDMAFWDLICRLEKKSLLDRLNLHSSISTRSSYTIGIGSLNEMIEKVRHSTFDILKIKLGTEEDAEIIREIKSITNAVLRVDANTGWQPNTAYELSLAMLENDVEFIEQPLPRESWKEMRNLKNTSSAIFIADESCMNLEDVNACADSFHGINIKLSKCGGISPALQMIKEAKRLNIKTMLGCMTESSVGISALAQLAPLVDYLDLDGALLIENDPAVGSYLDSKGRIIYSDQPGIGATLKL